MSMDEGRSQIDAPRLTLEVERSIEQGIQWVAFEPNAEGAWARVVREVSDYLAGLREGGELVGATASQAYFVRCDRSTMSQADIEAGRLVCLVGIAPLKPADFVAIEITQFTADAPARTDPRHPPPVDFTFKLPGQDSNLEKQDQNLL